MRNMQFPESIGTWDEGTNNVSETEFVQPPAPNFLPSDICTYNGYTYEYFVCRNRDCAAKG